MGAMLFATQQGDEKEGADDKEERSRLGRRRCKKEQAVA
jgi:hypothetical protein